VLDSFAYTYDNADRVSTESSTWGAAKTYAYDRDGQVRSDGSSRRQPSAVRALDTGIPIDVIVHESRVANVQNGTEGRSYSPATSVDVTDARNDPLSASRGR